MFFVPFTSVCEFEGFAILGIEEAAEDGFGMLENDFFGSGGAVAEWAAFSVNTKSLKNWKLLSNQLISRKYFKRNDMETSTCEVSWTGCSLVDFVGTSAKQK